MNEPAYLALARKDIGLTEIKGVKHSGRITGWLKKLSAWWSDDETPWCGVAVAGWLSECNIPINKTYYRALSWASYGYPCTKSTLGAIAVLERKGGGHVALVTGIARDGSAVRLLGGNQGDKVCEAWFDAARVIAYRLPVGIIAQPAPICTIGEFSKSEA